MTIKVSNIHLLHHVITKSAISYIFQSECLKEAFSELDMTSDVLQIMLSPDPPYFRLSTFGNAGSTHVSHSC